MCILLVHADSGSKAAAAHIGNACHIKQTLYGSVLAVFAVEHGENNVYLYKVHSSVGYLCDAAVKRVGENSCGNTVGVCLPAAVLYARNISGIEEPSSLFGDSHRDYLILVGV